jgi:hypothetical protein
MKPVTCIALIFAAAVSILAQDQERLDKRTPQEKKIDSPIFVSLRQFEDSLSAGVPRDQSMSCFHQFRRDTTNRIYVIIKVHGGNGEAQSAIEETGGSIAKDYLGKIYCWVKPESLRSLIKIETIIGIEIFHPPKTR